MSHILFVCMGNICRSPTVEAVARARFARAGLSIEVASAGTENYHVGGLADPRSIAAAARHGYPLGEHRPRQVCTADFLQFDHLLVMDRVNLHAVQRFRPPAGGIEPALFLGDQELPDPYYGEIADFERVIELAERGVDTWIERLRRAG